MGSESYHEPYETIRPETRDMHRAIVSLREELEAVDWYQQRADATDDKELQAILIHNKNEEIEHAMMVLEWIRRKNPVFAENAQTYLFSSGPVTEVEEAVTGGPGERGSIEGARGVGGRARSGPRDGSLGIGSLREG